jgi:molybdopterin molybdotransferase
MKVTQMTAVPAMPTCCDAPGLLSVEAARARAVDRVVAVSGEDIVPLRAARGRITLRAVSAGHAIPPFDQSAMDGYAVRTRDIADCPATLPVVARQPAGPTDPANLPDGPAAIRIFTGAPVPAGFDAVVMQEHCDRAANTVTIRKIPAVGEHVRRAGDDVPSGQTLVGPDTAIDARHVAMLAAAGVAEIPVRRRVRVAVLSTGNELREPGQPLKCGEIHDSNRAMLIALLASEATEITDLGGIPDNKAAISKTVFEASRSFDVIISTGGVSVGEEDHVGAAVLDAGGSFHPLKASIKPGKPASVGHVGSASIIALPGNPVSALVTYLWFGRPVLQRRMGLEPELPRAVGAASGFDELRHPGRDEFVPVVVSGRDEQGRPVLERRRAPGSARLSNLIGADGLARIPGLSAIRRGDPLGFHPFGCDFGL